MGGKRSRRPVIAAYFSVFSARVESVERRGAIKTPICLRPTIEVPSGGSTGR
jgi:hypothetical protein